MEILDKLIDKLDRKLGEARRDNPNDTTLAGRFTFGRHIVRYVFTPKGCEVEIYNPVLDTFLDRISFHCESCVTPWDSIEAEETDDWDLHGFRDEVDYLRYKFR